MAKRAKDGGNALLTIEVSSGDIGPHEYLSRRIESATDVSSE